MLSRAISAGHSHLQRRMAVQASSTYLFVDTPASNHSARVRFVVRKKGLDDLVKGVPLSHFGGLKSPEYLKMNPQGKFPTLLLPDGRSLPESEVIVQYLLDKFPDMGPTLVADTPETRAIGMLVTRIHDMYIASLQACMYRAAPSAEARAQDMARMVAQLDVIEATMVGGPFISGPTITTADGALFPTVVFFTHILPRHFGWTDVFAGRPKLRAWWAAVQTDPVASKIIEEVEGGLQAWEEADRWTTLGITQQVQSNPSLFLQGQHAA